MLIVQYTKGLHGAVFTFHDVIVLLLRYSHCRGGRSICPSFPHPIISCGKPSYHGTLRHLEADIRLGECVCQNLGSWAGLIASCYCVSLSPSLSLSQRNHGPAKVAVVRVLSLPNSQGVSVPADVSDGQPLLRSFIRGHVARLRVFYVVLVFGILIFFQQISPCAERGGSSRLGASPLVLGR